MPKQSGQKDRLLIVRDILFKHTDEDHLITRTELEDRMAVNGITVDKKTVYDDLSTIGNYDPYSDLKDDDSFDDLLIKRKMGRDFGYGISDRMRLFTLAELKILVDAVVSAKFLTERQAQHFLRKLESLCSVHQAKQLRRQVFINGRTRDEQTQAFKNVDILNRAIIEDKQVRFHYFRRNSGLEKVYGHEGRFYMLSPYALTWDNGKYYLIAQDMEDETGSVRHYRLDRMEDVEMIDRGRFFSHDFDSFQLAEYRDALFNMFGGKVNKVTLLCKKEHAEIILDRFGLDTMLIPEDKEHFKIHVHVADSQQFYAWVISLNGIVRVVGPDAAVEKMKQLISQLSKEYGID